MEEKELLQDEIKYPLPIKPLTWRGFPLFHIKFFKEDFDGTLYFLFGYGLGDTINNLRVLMEIKERFPYAHCIIYSDQRWDQFVDRVIGHLERVTKRNFPKGFDVRHPGKGTIDYEFTFPAIREDMGKNPGNVFLALGHFCQPDQYALGESTWESVPRSIGLIIEKNPWPLVPLLQEDIEWAKSFLKTHNIVEKDYAVLAPMTWPERMWKKEYVEEVCCDLFEKDGIRTIIIAHPEAGTYNIPESIFPLDLTIAQIAGIISLAKIFIGYDSGPAHMAAGLNIPSVVIFTDNGKPPFEVRPVSKKSMLVVSRKASRIISPSINTVRAAIHYQLSNINKATQEIQPPLCIACGRVMNYVTSGNNDKIELMCVCGVKKLIRINAKKNETKKLSAEKIDYSNIIDSEILTNRESINDFRMSLKKNNPLSISILMRSNNKIILEKESFTETEVCEGLFTWSMDGVVFFMRRQGYYLIEVLNQNKSDGETSTILKFSQEKKVTSLKFQWGGKTCKIKNNFLFYKYFSWSFWANLDRLESLPRTLINFSQPCDALLMASIFFKMDKNFKTTKWLLRSFVRCLREKSRFLPVNK